ncbi:MAG: homoserine O-succinyltransferase [endosymbiont of Galathealinum brachiosum]|uniref:Homoserine O-succinyltransferase n=1 Tax=endosymbiont of Galathealinum brachiosum TaxID=2200906 RepID=A0A370D860_9GAMM|nr:MAG: homoserine O-succinyltransferase [endosymbiont of Galathealinum brachiosum]
MPLVAHNQLPSFNRLRGEGIKVLAPDAAQHQDIRELHIGLLNMMPDAALAATERQFFRLIGESNPIAQFYVHPFTLSELPRSEKTQLHIDQYYETFEQIKEQGLDALIITGANVIGSELSNQEFWKPLIEVADWAHENVTSTLCSCLATHAVLEFRYNQKRVPQGGKKWGVFPHRVTDQSHPLVTDINTRFDVPHSRWNDVSRQQFEQANLKVLAVGDNECVHLAASEDGFRTIFFQGHPEYDTISLLKEYKREVLLFIEGLRSDYPPFPEHYFNLKSSAILREYKSQVVNALKNNLDVAEFPESLVVHYLDNTWHDTAGEVVGNWVGLVYQLTHSDRKKPFMDEIDIKNPLNL